MKVAQAASGMFRPLTSSNVESHLKNVGLDAEFATFRPASKVKSCFNLRDVLLAGYGRVYLPMIVAEFEPPTQAPPHLGFERRPESESSVRCRHVDAAPLSYSGRADELP